MCPQKAILEHPQVARTIATGYPFPFQSVKCEGCGQVYEGAYRLYRCDGAVLCETCTMEFILNNHSTQELADALNIEATTAHDIVTEDTEL